MNARGKYLVSDMKLEIIACLTESVWVWAAPIEGREFRVFNGIPLGGEQINTPSFLCLNKCYYENICPWENAT